MSLSLNNHIMWFTYIFCFLIPLISYKCLFVFLSFFFALDFDYDVKLFVDRTLIALLHYVHVPSSSNYNHSHAFIDVLCEVDRSAARMEWCRRAHRVYLFGRHSGLSSLSEFSFVFFFF